MADNVLVRVPNWIGDAVVSTGFIASCRAAHPNSRLTVLAHQRVGEIFESNPAIDEIMTFGNDGIWETSRSVRRRNFQRAYILPLSLSSALICCLGRVKERIGYDSELRGILLTKALPYSRIGFRGAHILEGYGKLLGEGNPPLAPRMVLTPAELERAYRLLLRIGVRIRDAVGFGPGATYGPAKMWPLENWVELGRKLAGEGKRILIFGSGSESDLCRDIALGIGSGAANLAGQASLRDSAALLGRLPSFVSNDTGAMHLAAAAGSRVTAIFGSTNPLWTGPWGPGHRVVQAGIDCSPCYRRFCRYGHYRCLKEIRPQEVWEAMTVPA